MPLGIEKQHSETLHEKAKLNFSFCGSKYKFQYETLPKKSIFYIIPKIMNQSKTLPNTVF